MGIIKNYHDKKWTLQFLDALYNSIDLFYRANRYRMIFIYLLNEKNLIYVHIQLVNEKKSLFIFILSNMIQIG
jgi:hypothetical protein